MRSRRLFLTLILAMAGPSLLTGQGTRILQPTSNEQGWILVSSQGRATVEQPGGRRKQLRLRSQEILTDFAETGAGWAAAGTHTTDKKKRIVVLEQSASGLQRIPDPASQTERMRLQPRLMIEKDELGGLAWLEGREPGSLSVRSANWTGSEWEPVEVVSLPIKGSQTGLTSTVLADGSWLLVWAAFDGHDDDIYWSQKQGTNWTSPTRLTGNNNWPDITPELIATRTGALVAWSRFDGNDYRLTISRFDGTRWGAPQTVGDRGSVDPQLTTSGGRTYLLFNSASTATWSVLEIQPSGRVGRRASLPGPGDEMPVLTWTSSYQVGLRSPSIRETTALWGADR
jgi:hypothetical protein